jgi:hypothetical protein
LEPRHAKVVHDPSDQYVILPVDGTVRSIRS